MDKSSTGLRLQRMFTNSDGPSTEANPFHSIKSYVSQYGSHPKIRLECHCFFVASYGEKSGHDCLCLT